MVGWSSASLPIALVQVVLGLGVSIVLAGCFGGSDDSENFTLAASRDCFAARGDEVVREGGFPAKASGGWLTVNPGGGWWIGFAADESEAKRIKSKVEGDTSLPPPFGREVVRRGNAVYYASRDTMPPDMRENIEACLK